MKDFIRKAFLTVSSLCISALGYSADFGTSISKTSSMDTDGRTYAVILSGGKNFKDNGEKYWNDCSFFYSMLRNKYYIPKSNIEGADV